MVTELLSRPKQSRQHFNRSRAVEHGYHGWRCTNGFRSLHSKFRPGVHLFRGTRPGKTERQPKAYIRFHGKSKETKYKPNKVTLALHSAISGENWLDLHEKGENGKLSIPLSINWIGCWVISIYQLEMFFYTKCLGLWAQYEHRKMKFWDTTPTTQRCGWNGVYPIYWVKL